MTFTEIKTAIKSFCGLTTTDADTRVGEAINRHYQRITSSLGIQTSRFVTRSASMTIGVQTVTFSSIEKIDRVRDVTDSSAVRLVHEVNIHAIRSDQPGDAEPQRWAPQTNTSSTVTILTDTVPQSAYSLQADGWSTLADLSGSDEPVFPASFHDVLTFAVIAEELGRKEKWEGADRFEARSESLLSDLRFHLADSPDYSTRQGTSATTSGFATGGGGSAPNGGTSYTQSGLLTFDRGAGVAPFAVAQATAAVVTNLDADKLDGQHGSYYLDRTNHTGTLASTALTMSATDRLVGRDTASGGASEEISVGGGLEFTGSAGIQRSALTGDVTASAGSAATTIANDAVTYAKMQNVSATDMVLGRSTAGAGNVEEIACTAAGRALLDDASAAAQRTTLGVGTGDSPTFVATTLTNGQVVFPGTQVPSSGANTLDDYEEGTWTPAITGTGGGSGQAYTTQVGSYLKIGKLVFISGRLTLSTLGTVTTSAVITGLPFAAQNTANMKSTVHIGDWQNLGSSLSYVSGVIEPNESQIRLYGTTSAAGLTALASGNFGNTSDLVFSGMYRAAD